MNSKFFLILYCWKQP